MLYKIVLVSAKHQHESAIGIHMSSPSETFPPPSSTHPSRSLQSPSLGSWSHTAHSPWLSILHMVMYTFPCCSKLRDFRLRGRIVCYREDRPKMASLKSLSSVFKLCNPGRMFLFCISSSLFIR